MLTNHRCRPRHEPMTDDEWFALHSCDIDNPPRPSDWPRYEATRQDVWFLFAIGLAASLCAIVARFLEPWSNYVLIPLLLDLGICVCFRKRNGQYRNQISTLLTFPCSFVWFVALFIPTLIFSSGGKQCGLAYLLLLFALQLIALGREIIEHYIDYALHHHMLSPARRSEWEKLRPVLLGIFRQQGRGREAHLYIAPVAAEFQNHVRLRRGLGAICFCCSLLLCFVSLDEELPSRALLLALSPLLGLPPILLDRRWLLIAKPILVFLHSSKPSKEPSQRTTRDRRVFFFAHLLVAFSCLFNSFCAFSWSHLFPSSVLLVIVPPALVLLLLAASLIRACHMVNMEFEDVGAIGHTDEFHPYPADDHRHVPESEWLETRRLNAEFARRNYRNV